MNSEAPEADRREAPRRVLRRSASLVLPGNQLVPARTVDISLTGMAIVLAANPPVGMACGLRLSLPTPEGGSVQIEPRVKVMQSLWSTTDNGFKAGLSFQSLTPQQTRALRDFMST